MGPHPPTGAHMREFAKEHNLLFVPSVGPGYDDSFIRPWNIRNRKKRKDGEYYRLMWDDAIASIPDAVSITSFNGGVKERKLDNLKNYRERARSRGQPVCYEK